MLEAEARKAESLPSSIWKWGGLVAQYLIGHDVGTGGSKSVLVDTSGGIIASTFSPYEVSYPRAGWAEQDPDDWWRAVAGATRTLLEDGGVDPSDVTGMGFAGQMIGVVPVGENGGPLCPAIIWLDSRADEQASSMVRRMGGERVCLRVAGAVPSGKDVVCKLAWIRENEPGVYRDTAQFLDATGYLVLRATGERVMDQTGAGGTGILDNRKREWSRPLAWFTRMPLEKMPPVRSSIDVIGGLTADAAEEMGLPEGVPVIAGMGDIPAAATGSGALEDGDAHIYLGTSSWLCLSIGRPCNLGKNGILSIASPDPDMFIMIGESETAGICLEWLADNLATGGGKGADEGSAYREMDAAIERVEPGSGKLVFAPWMFGERAPVTDTTLRAAFLNLSLEHRREHMLRAVYEGIAYNLRWMMDAVDGAGLHFDSVRAIGGGAKSDVWMRIMADATGRRVDAVVEPQEAGAVGVALAAAVGLGVLGCYKDIKKVVRVRKSFEPDRDLAPVYDEIYRAFRDFYPALSRAGRLLNSER